MKRNKVFTNEQENAMVIVTFQILTDDQLEQERNMVVVFPLHLKVIVKKKSIYKVYPILCTNGTGRDNSNIGTIYRQ